MTIEVKGVDQLNRKLLKIMDIKNMQAPMEMACAYVEGQAKELCPVDDGQLRQSITYEVLDEGKTGVIGTNVEYAPYVHQGTGIYAKNGDGRKTPWSYQDDKGNWHTTMGQHPNPFLEKALDSSVDKIQEIFSEQYRKEIEKHV